MVGSGLAGGSTKLDRTISRQGVTGDEILETFGSMPPTTVLRRAVVVEVIYDLAAVSEKELLELKDLVGDYSNKVEDDPHTITDESDVRQLLLSAPRNTILARVISQGQDHRAQKTSPDGEGTDHVVCKICYPFFPPYLCLPVKPGEVVWLIDDDPNADNIISHWICRVPGTDSCDDINYTHVDRRFAPYLLPPKSITPKIDADLKEYIYGFPNGLPPEAMTLAGIGDFEYIVQESKSYDETFTPEPIPRYTKRPADLVLQGSNNALISLGQDRGWTISSKPGSKKNKEGNAYSNATKEPDQRKLQQEQTSGTIDMVTGRGRYTFPFIGSPGDIVPEDSTSPQTIKCTPPRGGRKGYVETNKNPAGGKYIKDEGQKENRLTNPNEGDPDFNTDASRIYISMATSVDKNFNIDTPGTTIPTPFEKIELSDDISTAGGSKLPAAIINKSDQIRLIARRFKPNQPFPKSPEIKGSIRLIKEGDPKDDLSALLMLEDGTIQMSGKKIFLGRSGADGIIFSDYGAAGPGPGESQPYIRFSDLKKLFEEMWQAMDKYCETTLKHVTPGGGMPSPQILQAAAELQASFAKMKADTSTFNKLGSERIFGE